MIFESRNVSFVLVFALLLIEQSCLAQVFLQLERAYEVKPYRFVRGDQFTFQSVSFPGQWQVRTIDYLVPEQQLVVFEDGIFPLGDITKVQRIVPSARIAGYSLMTFGTTWFVFGGLGHIASRLSLTGPERYTFSSRDAIIGGLGLGIGAWLTYYVSKRVHVMGSISRLRIIDIGFPSAPSN